MTMQATILSRIANGRQAVLALVLAVLGLGGCGATHVGDAWQCPLAQGAACTSVAEADPAAARPAGAKVVRDREPLPWTETGNDEDPGATCAGGCDPLAWLADWLMAAGTHDGGPAVAESDSTPSDEELPDASGDGLRTKEKIARIWIAPFVDAEGVYREGHWVRAVLEPARWRLP